MKKKIWIMNHYAADQFFNEGGRHYWFAEQLKKKGYDPVIFCANTRHNSNEQIDMKNKKFTTDTKGGLPFVFVNTVPYEGNGVSRIRNMVSFYKNIFPVVKDYAKYHGKPDIILASSVHPLTMIAGVKIAKKFGIPCICEVRDLWPETIVAYGALKRENPFAKLLYKGEKWIYKKADAVVMTWEGGKDYIAEQGWGNEVDLAKVHHINNGVVIDSFDENIETFVTEDPDLDDGTYKNIVYAGSIRKVNNLGMLLNAAKVIQEKALDDKIRFLIYGAGDELKMLEERVQRENIHNVLFKGRVDKKYIPGIVKKAYVNILHNSSTSLDKYGQSQNKLFEYMAAGKPIVQTYTTGYSVIKKYDCGISAPVQNAEEIAEAVVFACSDEQKHKQMGENARHGAYDYDFENLTDQLIDIVERI